MDFTSTGWTAGETVSAFAVSATPPGGPSGASQASDVAGTSGSVTFEGLILGTRYLAVGGTSGRRVRFMVASPPSTGGGGGGAGAELLWDAGTDSYVPADLLADTSVRRDFYGPTAPDSVDGVVLAQYDIWIVTSS